MKASWFSQGECSIIDFHMEASLLSGAYPKLEPVLLRHQAMNTQLPYYTDQFWILVNKGRGGDDIMLSTTGKARKPYISMHIQTTDSWTHSGVTKITRNQSNHYETETGVKAYIQFRKRRQWFESDLQYSKWTPKTCTFHTDFIAKCSNITNTDFVDMNYWFKSCWELTAWCKYQHSSLRIVKATMMQDRSALKPCRNCEWYCHWLTETLNRVPYRYRISALQQVGMAALSSKVDITMLIHDNNTYNTALGLIQCRNRLLPGTKQIYATTQTVTVRTECK